MLTSGTWGHHLHGGLNLSICRNGMHKGVQRVLRMRHYCISRDVMQRLETCATSNAPLLGGDTHVSSTLYRDHNQRNLPKLLPLSFPFTLGQGNCDPAEARCQLHYHNTFSSCRAIITSIKIIITSIKITRSLVWVWKIWKLPIRGLKSGFLHCLHQLRQDDKIIFHGMTRALEQKSGHILRRYSLGQVTKRSMGRLIEIWISRRWIPQYFDCKR